jgi:hypothetical protein
VENNFHYEKLLSLWPVTASLTLHPNTFQICLVEKSICNSASVLWPYTDFCHLNITIINFNFSNTNADISSVNSVTMSKYRAFHNVLHDYKHL